MKTMIKKSILVVALFIATFANASSGKTGVTLTVVEAKLVQLQTVNYKGQVEVTVKDVFGVTLHNETLMGTEISKKYDFGSLPLGNYNVEIETETKIESVDFQVTSSQVELIKTNEVYFKPIVNVVDDLVSISKLSMTGGMMEVSIYNNEDELIYYQKVSNGPNLGVRLSFEILGAGNYRARMFSGGRLFTEDFTIK